MQSSLIFGISQSQVFSKFLSTNNCLEVLAEFVNPIFNIALMSFVLVRVQNLELKGATFTGIFLVVFLFFLENPFN